MASFDIECARRAAGHSELAPTPSRIREAEVAGPSGIGPGMLEPEAERPVVYTLAGIGTRSVHCGAELGGAPSFIKTRHTMRTKIQMLVFALLLSSVWQVSVRNALELFLGEINITLQTNTFELALPSIPSIPGSLFA
jgi:hypothetical protein